MREWIPCFTITFVLVEIAMSQVALNSHAADGLPSRKEAAVKLDAALNAADELSDPEQKVSLLRSASAEALKTGPVNIFVDEIIQRLEHTNTTNPEKLVKEWRSGLIDARDILRFEVVEESPLPEGFPEPTPVGEIRLQQYPDYRLARTDMTLLEANAFWTLFNHIKERDIAMTAPVEMTYTAEGDAPKKVTAMSFMYRSTKQGELGNAGKVQVIDVPAQMAVSIGIQGNATKLRVAEVKRHLEEWLQTHRDDYESAGPLRVMGYNGPFLPEKKQFAEIQIPVRPKKSSAVVTP